jgi:hypothetical protein
MGTCCKARSFFQSLQTFIDDLLGQIITMVAVGVQQFNTSGVNVNWLFINKHSKFQNERCGGGLAGSRSR